MNIVEFYRLDLNNPGDFYSNPSRYFFSNEFTTKIDIDNVRRTTWSQSDIIIVGGGGLLGNPNFEAFVNRITVHPDEQLLKDILEIKIKNVTEDNRVLMQDWKDNLRVNTIRTLEKLNKETGLRILWGAGINTRDKDDDSYGVQYPSYVDKFHLVGVRDFVPDYKWVPCASCMHSAFNKKYEITNKVVWFEHKKRLIDNKSFDVYPCPRMVNTGQNMDQIIEFLGSAETVVTNSYHGVYWATLLNRKVVCIPWSNKFNFFKHPPTMATDRNWADKIEDSISYKDALEECRLANVDFFNSVKNMIDKC